MKKSIFFLFVLCYTVSFSQGIRFLQGNTDVTGTTVTEKINDDHPLTQFRLYNSTNEDKKIIFSRIIKSKLLPDYRFAAVVDCNQYPPMEDSIFTFNDTVRINAHQYLPNTITKCTGLDMYLFIDGACREYVVNVIAQDASGSTEVTIHYICPNGIDDQPWLSNIINVYPNPAASVATIDYALNSTSASASLILDDVLGRVWRTIPLVKKEGKVEIPTAELQSGLYFCRLIVNDHPVSTSKLIVSHD